LIRFDFVKPLLTFVFHDAPPFTYGCKTSKTSALRVMCTKLAEATLVQLP